MNFVLSEGIFCFGLPDSNMINFPRIKKRREIPFVSGAEKMVLFIWGTIGSFDMRRQS